MTPTFATKWLIPRLPALTAVHPRIDLRILASERIANFQADAVDIAVRSGQPPFGSSLKSTLLFDQRTIAVASPTIAERLHNGPDSLTLLQDSHDLWPQFLDLARADIVPSAVRNVRFNQTSLAIDAALSGQGLALSSHVFVAEDLAAGRLLQIFGASLRTGTDFYLIHPRKPRNAAAVDAVHSWLLAHTSL